ncbi:hypothetical protein JCM17960_34400 [Magnetospira thiophila]
MKRILLVGCGAEIGSLLVGMVEPEKDGFEIGAILTHQPETDAKYPEQHPLDSLIARVVLAQPHLLDATGSDRQANALTMRGRSIPVIWGDATAGPPEGIGHFDLCVIATSKRHINDSALMNSYLSVADWVIGVAESITLPGLYPSLLGVPETFLPVKPQRPDDRRVFCLGSCQTNGWQAQWRALLETARLCGLEKLDFRACEVDIVHPDTPTGRLGTKALSARQQEARNNFRPSFSQAALSMDRLLPDSANINTISLRTLIAPPGYQISRFFFEYDRPGGAPLAFAEIVAGFRETADRLPSILRVSDLPLGSHAFEMCEAAAVVLPQPTLLTFRDDPFRLGERGAPKVSELIVQAYVHNTRGYCRSTMEAIRALLYDPDVKVFAAP